jgi:hypothetical protein
LKHEDVKYITLRENNNYEESSREEQEETYKEHVLKSMEKDKIGFARTKHPCMAHVFFPDCLCTHCQGLRSTFFELCIKYDAHLLSDPSQNHIRKDTELEICGHKKSACPPSCVKFCTLTLTIC